jgi:hypothetical protein
MGKKIIFPWVSVKDRERSKNPPKYHEKSVDIAALLLRSPKKWVAMERILETRGLCKCKCEAILQPISASKNLD